MDVSVEQLSISWLSCVSVDQMICERISEHAIGGSVGWVAVKSVSDSGWASAVNTLDEEVSQSGSW